MNQRPQELHLGRGATGDRAAERSRHEARLARRHEVAAAVVSERRADRLDLERAESRSLEVAVVAGDFASLAHAVLFSTRPAAP
jgi:hypothetical protein